MVHKTTQRMCLQELLRRWTKIRRTEVSSKRNFAGGIVICRNIILMWNKRPKTFRGAYVGRRPILPSQNMRINTNTTWHINSDSNCGHTVLDTEFPISAI